MTLGAAREAIGPHARAGAGRARLWGAATALRIDQREENVMRFANAVKGAAGLTIGRIVSGRAGRVGPPAGVGGANPVPRGGAEWAILGWRRFPPLGGVAGP